MAVENTVQQNLWLYVYLAKAKYYYQFDTSNINIG